MNYDFLNTLPIAISVTSFDEKIRFYNKAFTSLFGYVEKDIPSKINWMERAFPEIEYRNKVIEMWTEDLQHFHISKKTPASRTLKIKCKDGHSLIVTSSISIEDNNIITSYTDVTKEFSTKNILQNQEDRFALIANNTSDIVAVHALDGSFMYISPSCKELLGYEQKELIGGNPMEYIHPDDIEPATSATIKAIETGDVSTIIHRIRLKNGELKYFECWMRAIKDEISGEPIGIVANSRDISKHISYENELKLYSDIFENITSGIHIFQLENLKDDRSLRLISSNKESEKLTKLINNEIVGKTIDEALPGLREQNVPAIIKNVIETGIPTELENISDTNAESPEFYNIRIFPLPDSKAGVSFVKVTEKLRTEQALKKSKELYKILAENISDVIWIRDFNLKLTYISPSVKNLRGFTQEEALKQTPEENMTIESAQQTYKILNDALNDIKLNPESAHQTKTFESEIIKKDGTTVWCEIKASFIKDENNKPIAILGSSRSIEERKKIEQQLRLQNAEYQKLNEALKKSNAQIIKINKKREIAKKKAEESDRLKTAFLQNMSHEIRTPMNGIMGFAELLQTVELPPDKQKKYLETIETSSRRLLTVVNDILDISQIETNQIRLNITDVEINELLEEMYLLFQNQAEAKNIQLLLEKLPLKSCFLRVDKDRFSQIFTNLLSNAIKFTEKGSVTFGYSISHNKITFLVKDTGIGIHPSVQDKIFDRFNQADADINVKYGGTGLGLAIAKGFTEIFNGTISVESEQDKGTTFYITLPFENLNPLKKTEIRDNDIQHQNKFPSYSILIAEDEDLNYYLLEEILSGLAISNITRAYTGKEALQYYTRGYNFDIIFMDIKMPEMNGYDATKEIRKINSKVPIIAVTAYAMTNDMELSIKAGCNEHIAKPLSKNKIIELIEKYLS